MTEKRQCHVLSLINSQLLKAVSAWWELLVHPQVGWGSHTPHTLHIPHIPDIPHIPHASHFWQGHRPGDTSRKPEYICDVSLSRHPKTESKEPKHSKMWLRTSKPWCGTKRSMRNGSCLLSCPRSCPHGNTHPCHYHWSFLFVLIFPDIFCKSKQAVFSLWITTALITCVHPPLSTKLETCKKQGKSPCDFITDGKGSGWEGMASPSWKDLFQQQRSWQRVNVWARPQEKQWEDHHHHQYKADAGSWRDTCTAKLHIWMCRNGWGLWTSSPEKISEKHLHGI